MPSASAAYLTFWGKAQPIDAPPKPQWHPTAFHLLDVAAAADALLSARRWALARGAALLGLDPSATQRLVVVLAALHDLGKFGRAFQAKVKALWPGDVLGPYHPPVAGQAHTADGLWLWEDALGSTVAERLWPAGSHVLHAIAPAVFGHHGRPVIAGRGPVVDGLSAGGVAAARACADDVLALLHPDPITADPPASLDPKYASWWVSGMLTVADWIGSQQQHFAYTAPDLGRSPAENLAAYRLLAWARAEHALREAGLVPAESAAPRSFAALTGIQDPPSPVQKWAGEVELPRGPVLVIVEDVTGAGKTEAAQLLVHRLMVEGRATGAFWAMPTQATANAMYERQADALGALFADGARPSLVLAHGQSRLHQGFRATVFGTPSRRADETAPPALRGAGDADLPSSAACAAFLADDRRAALLADVGAGTVDQAVLGVLAGRFNTVRLFGLADKVLVLDEAHAYDPYLAEEVAALLRFQALLGGSAVVLSATLARAQWDALVGAWRGGVDGAAVARVSAWRRPAAGTSRPTREDGYPLATVVSHAPGADGVRQRALDAAPWSERRVAVRFLRNVDAALDAVLHAHAAGGAVAWVRNTVDECLDAAAALRARGIADVTVFHARFAQCDRQRREQEVLKTYGKPRGVPPEAEDHRRGRVLVATQVIEQSLDLDFDVLVSDLAPVDLLIQRAGRLWRHAKRDAWRTARGFERALLVLAPEAVEAPAAEWPAPLLPKVRRVYARVDVLWRTARALEQAGAIATPGNPGDPAALRALVAAVYDAPLDTPEVIEAAAERARTEQKVQQSTAVYVTLKPGDGYQAHAAEWQNDLHAPTRLGDDQVAVRLARVGRDGALCPWSADDPRAPAWKRWALSEVKLSAWRVPAGSHAEPEFDAAVAAVRAEWGRFEQEMPVLPLIYDGTRWYGRLHRPDKDVLVVFYTEHGGLAFA